MGFQSLSGRHTAAAVLIVFVTVSNVAFDAVSFAMLDATGDDALALFGTAAGLLILGQLVAAIFFLRWLNRAAKNVRVFHPGAHFEFTTGWVVGWWFVPFANLIKPLRAVQEIWRASDPDCVGTDRSFLGAPVPGLMSTWWGAWIASSLLGNLSGRIEDPAPSAVIGAIATAFTIVACVAVLRLMKELGERQGECWRKIHDEPTLRSAMQHAAAADPALRAGLPR